MAGGSGREIVKTAGSDQDAATRSSVREYYGSTLQSSKDLKTSACTATGKPHPEVRQLLSKVPDEVLDKFYGCGAPLPLGIDGLRVLDLGSGSGRDAYVCAALVGEKGQVVGIDMTASLLEVAGRHAAPFCQSLGYAEPNMRFVQGNIERMYDAGLEDSSFDIIISNCVINLCPDKRQVLQEAYRVLADGGELHFSDVYFDRRLPESVKKNEVLWGEGVAGALYIEDFKRLAKTIGFEDVRQLSITPISIFDPSMLAVVGNAKFHSITFRLFKLPGLLESSGEDYGQFAVYKGSIPGQQHSYTLDAGHTFQAGKPALICGNTAAMLGENERSWLSRHFQVHGDRTVHYGIFGECETADFAAGEDTSAASCC